VETPEPEQSSSSPYIPGSFKQLELEHVRHRMAGLGVIDPDCLWCNGTLTNFWRNVNLDTED
jgi:hypothetical protein